MTTAGFPHSDTLGSQPGCRLPEDYRRLQRPSSAPGTKTSTVCPYKLDTRHYMQFLQKTEDARVHYAVLKIRTEPCVKTPHPEGLDCKAVRVSALEKRLLPQDPTVCSPGEAISSLVQRHRKRCAY
jgi:hypothetical protein